TIPEAASDSGGFRRGAGGSGPVARRKEPESVREEQESPFHAVAAASLVEDALGSAEPAFGRAELSAQDEAETDPEGSSRSMLEVAGPEMEVVRTLVGGDPLVLTAAHVRSRRQELEIRRPERLRLVRATQQLVRVGPSARGVRVASTLECARRLPLPRH